jgi:hypothetical protein
MLGKAPGRGGCNVCNVFADTYCIMQQLRTRPMPWTANTRTSISAHPLLPISVRGCQQSNAGAHVVLM